MNAPPDITVILPCYDEEAAVAGVIRDVTTALESTGRLFEILVVDDGSRDATERVAREAGARVIRHPRNLGVGRARKTGLRGARGETIVMIDADGTYPAAEIPRLLEELESCDMVVGARTTEAGTVRMLRSLAKHSIRYLASFIVGHRIPDLNSGLRAFRRRTALKFLNILPDTHSWVSTITLAYLANEYEVRYVPIDYFRRIGHSTFHPLKDTYHYFLLVIRTVTLFNPLKFFVPISVLLTIWGLGKFIFDWQVYSDVRESDIMIILTGIIVGVLGILGDLIVTESRGRYLPDVQDRPPDPLETHAGREDRTQS